MHALMFYYRKWRLGVCLTLGIKWDRIAFGTMLTISPSHEHILVESGICLGPVWFSLDVQLCTHAAHDHGSDQGEATSENH